MTPPDLKDLIEGSRKINFSLGGSKEILEEEKPTIDFAYACVVTINKINEGETLTKENIWVKRPGTGAIKAKEYKNILGKKALRNLEINEQLCWEDFE